MICAKAFFDLQLQFANKVTALSGLPFARVLFEYTNLYVRFALGRNFDPAHPTWQEYVADLRDTNDSCEWTYRFYLTRSEAMAQPPVVATFGCFSYALLPCPAGADRTHAPDGAGCAAADAWRYAYRGQVAA